jgi:hypothetical protein
VSPVAMASSAVPDPIRYVLKEGKKIGIGYYLVEMSTDGRTLTISAYDGESQQTLELMINEKNHRKLYRECAVRKLKKTFHIFRATTQYLQLGLLLKVIGLCFAIMCRLLTNQSRLNPRL